MSQTRDSADWVMDREQAHDEISVESVTDDGICWFYDPTTPVQGEECLGIDVEDAIRLGEWR